MVGLYFFWFCKCVFLFLYVILITWTHTHTQFIAIIYQLEDRETKTGDWMFLSRKILPFPALAKLYRLFQLSLKNFLSVYQNFMQGSLWLLWRARLSPPPLQGLLQYREMCEAKFHDGMHVDK